VGEEQATHGAGDADEAEASFFFELVGVGVGAVVGEQAVFEGDDGDGVELEALGGVEGHEGHGAGVGLDGVDVGDQSDALEEGEELVFER